MNLFYSNRLGHGPRVNYFDGMESKGCCQITDSIDDEGIEYIGTCCIIKILSIATFEIRKEGGGEGLARHRYMYSLIVGLKVRLLCYINSHFQSLEF